MSGSKEQPGSREITENLTRQQLQELEERKKHRCRGFWTFLLRYFRFYAAVQQSGNISVSRTIPLMQIP